VHFFTHNVRQSIIQGIKTIQSETREIYNHGKHPPTDHPDGLETKPELIQIAELLDKDIKTLIIILFHMFKKLNRGIKKSIINNLAKQKAPGHDGSTAQYLRKRFY